MILTEQDLDGLPPEVLAELSKWAVRNPVDAAILKEIEDRGGQASLDQIIVGIYRRTGRVVRRSTAASRLFRLVRKGEIHPDKTLRGVYTRGRAA